MLYDGHINIPKVGQWCMTYYMLVQITIIVMSCHAAEWEGSDRTTAPWHSVHIRSFYHAILLLSLSLSQISYITAYWSRTGNLELYIKCILKLIISYLFMHKCISLYVRLMHFMYGCWVSFTNIYSSYCNSLSKHALNMVLSVVVMEDLRISCLRIDRPLCCFIILTEPCIVFSSPYLLALISSLPLNHWVISWVPHFLMPRT